MPIAKNIQTMIYTTRLRELKIEQLVTDINGGGGGGHGGLLKHTHFLLL